MSFRIIYESDSETIFSTVQASLIGTAILNCGWKIISVYVCNLSVSNFISRVGRSICAVE